MNRSYEIHGDYVWALDPWPGPPPQAQPDLVADLVHIPLQSAIVLTNNYYLTSWTLPVKYLWWRWARVREKGRVIEKARAANQTRHLVLDDRQYLRRLQKRKYHTRINDNSKLLHRTPETRPQTGYCITKRIGNWRWNLCRKRINTRTIDDDTRPTGDIRLWSKLNESSLNVGQK